MEIKRPVLARILPLIFIHTHEPMRPVNRLIIALLSFGLILIGCRPLQELQQERVRDLSAALKNRQLPFTVPPGTKLDSVIIDPASKKVTVRLSKEFSYQPYRPDNVKSINRGIQTFLSDLFDGYAFSVQTMGHPIEELVPNYYRPDPSMADRSRMPRQEEDRPFAVVQNISKPIAPSAGLQKRNIVLWHSHGWYYNNKEDRWEWQRPRLFETVEDLVPMSFTIPYLVPMLENAGANVFLPRERDIQTNEAVVDGDTPGASYREAGGTKGLAWKKGDGPGFARGTPPYAVNVNPFFAGTHRITPADTVPTATATWTPDIPEAGWYAVYISYGSSRTNVPDAHYTVFHEGGTTEFRVNQQEGGGTWIYLGTFRFSRGTGSGRVVLTNQSARPGGRVVSADAVRFGGGMGIVARNGRTSGRARYLEAARYYLQYAGMPDTLVYNLNKSENDYSDDYQSRPEYANYLRGAPYGPNRDRKQQGLGIPVDLTLAFHTDAGITHNDTTIGTLSIFSTEDAESTFVFPDSVSRLANRDLADILQTQLVSDIRMLHDPWWNRRQLMNSKYSEAFRPNVPGVLLELLSHQNFLDMKFMLDPRFRFDVARAIYKAMLRFLTYQHSLPYVVQPLPPSHLSTEFTPDGGVLLRWRPTLDQIEPTAAPDLYIVYTRINDGGFDNGILADRPSAVMHGIATGTIYSYKVAAVNSGGESFPSEILSVCRVDGGKQTAMIINGFDRVAGPATVETPAFTGFLNDLDAGVPDRYALNFTGTQYDFNPGSPFRTNDAPGHGASHADREGTVIAGNSFDYPFIHGQSLRANGLSFLSASRDAVTDTMVDLSRYHIVDLILGKQRETRRPRPAMDSLRGTMYAAFPPGFRAALTGFCKSGGRLFVSGAYVGTDLFAGMKTDSTKIRFAKEILHMTWVTDHAARTGKVFSVSPSFLAPDEWTAFRPDLDREMYGVESPDALAPANGAKLVLRYAENQFGAATAFKGEYRVVVFGFPFETIAEAGKRNEVMRAVVNFLGSP